LFNLSFLSASCSNQLLLTSPFEPNANGSFSGTVTNVGFFPSSSVALSLGGSALGTVSSTSAQLPVASLLVFVKTSTVYWDDNVLTVFYQVRDAVGRTSCQSSGVSVNVVIGSISSACSMFSSTQPNGLCTASLPLSMFKSFTSTIAIEVEVLEGGKTIAKDSSGNVTISAVIAHPMPGTLGAFAVLPQHVSYVGDTVIVAVSICTATSDVNTWDLSINYNSTVVSFVSVAAPLFNSPVANAVGGILYVNAVGRLSSTMATSVVGCFSLLKVTFLVASSEYSSVPFSGTVNQLITSNSVKFLENVPMNFADLRGGWQTTGQFITAKPSIGMLYGFTDAGSVLNTAVMTGTSVSHRMTVKGVFNTGRSRFADVACRQSALHRRRWR